MSAMTASERAIQLNAKNDARAKAAGRPVYFRLMEGAADWAEYDVHTADDLDHHLAMEAHWGGYKDIHGIRPRWIDYDAMTTAEIDAMTSKMYADQEREEAEDAAALADATNPAPLTHSPFAVLA